MQAVQFSLKYNRKKRLNKKGLAPVSLVAYKRNAKTSTKHKYFSTGISLEPHQWNKEKSIIVNHPMEARLNFRLSDLISSYSRKSIELMNRYGDCSLDDLAANKESNYQSFVEFYEKEIELERPRKKKSTITTYETCLTRLKEYRNKIYFTDLDYRFIQGFDSYLRTQNLRQTVIANKYHSKLRYIINQAVRKDLIESNPYSRFKVSDGIPRPKEFLEMDEIARLENLEFEPAEMYLEIENDAYLFSVYTGLRNGTNIALKLSMFEIKDGEYYMNTRAKKGEGKYISFPLAKLFPCESGPSKPEKIIMKYEQLNKDIHGHKYLGAPLFTRNLINQTSNKRLKILAKRAGISKNLTTHTGRVSFAVHMADKIPIHYLQAILGHSKIETTMVYAQLSEKLISNRLDKIEWQ